MVECSVLIHGVVFGPATLWNVWFCYTVECSVLLGGGNVLSCETVERGIFDPATLTLRKYLILLH